MKDLLAFPQESNPKKKCGCNNEEHNILKEDLGERCFTCLIANKDMDTLLFTRAILYFHVRYSSINIPKTGLPFLHNCVQFCLIPSC